MFIYNIWLCNNCTVMFSSDSTELPKRLSLDSSSSLESLASSTVCVPPAPMGYPNPPSPLHVPDSLASDAISVYSLSSIASSMSFLSRPEGTSDFISQRSRQQELERHRGGAGCLRPTGTRRCPAAARPRTSRRRARWWRVWRIQYNQQRAVG